MKERPILFSGPMVRAIMEGQKTQTRRVIGLAQFGRSDTPGYGWTFRGTRNGGRGHLWQDFRHEQMLRLCKFGTPGDRLWVRETFSDSEPVFYRADGIANDSDMRWKPSIFMPRELSRLTLEIVAVRVERVQDISHDDAVAEGCFRIEPCAEYPHGNAWGRLGFSHLWDTINAVRGHGWENNPWVWVVEFKRI